MVPPESDTHHIAYLRQDNGELQEDVVTKESTGGEPASGGGVDDDEVDEEAAASFPASDAPSYWSGGDRPARQGSPEGGTAASRVVGSAPVEEVGERRDPTDPVPRTLPRSGAGGDDPDDPEQRA